MLRKVIEAITRTPQIERTRPMIASCSAGFTETIELVDSDGEGFAPGKYTQHLANEHNIWHHSHPDLSCQGLQISYGTVTTQAR